MYDILINNNELALRNCDSGYTEMIGIVNNVCININDNSNKKNKFVGFDVEYLTFCYKMLDMALTLRSEGYNYLDILSKVLEKLDLKEFDKVKL